MKNDFIVSSLTYNSHLNKAHIYHSLHDFTLFSLKEEREKKCVNVNVYFFLQTRQLLLLLTLSKYCKHTIEFNRNYLPFRAMREQELPL